MPIPIRPTNASPDRRWLIRITDDASPTLVQAATDDAMHSGCGALAETRHVYLTGSGVAQRLAAGQATRVLEVGLGSGMAWLLSADVALAHHTPLVYVGLENLLPPESVIRQLDLGRFLRRPDLLESYCRWLGAISQTSAAAGPTPQSHTFQFECVGLQLELGDAVQWCLHGHHDRWRDPGQQFNAIYFDPYSPATSPRLWQRDIFAALRNRLAPAGMLASYCVSRPVRDALAAAGYVVSRVPGPPGGKREVLLAQPAPPSPADQVAGT